MAVDTPTKPKGKEPKEPREIKTIKLQKVEDQPHEPSTREKVVELWEQGKTGAEIAKELELHPGSVYRYTRALDHSGREGRGGGNRPTIMVELEDGTTLPRSTYIKEQFESGRPIGEIAKEVGVSYAVAYSTAHPYRKSKSDEPEEGDETEGGEEVEGEEQESAG